MLLPEFAHVMCSYVQRVAYGFRAVKVVHRTTLRQKTHCVVYGRALVAANDEDQDSVPQKNLVVLDRSRLCSTIEYWNKVYFLIVVSLCPLSVRSLDRSCLDHWVSATPHATGQGGSKQPWPIHYLLPDSSRFHTRGKNNRAYRARRTIFCIGTSLVPPRESLQYTSTS